MKYTLVAVERPCLQMAIVEHDDNATDEEIFEKALSVKDSSQLTEPYIPPEMSGDDFITAYELHEVDKVEGVPHLLTKHEFLEAMQDIEESKRVVEKPKRRVRKKVQDDK